MDASARHLQLDRKLVQHNFTNWKLSRPAGTSQHTIQLPVPVNVRAASGTDYLHTRASILHNHLLFDGEQVLLFLDDEEGHSTLHEVTSEGALFKLGSLGRSNVAVEELGGLVEGALHCSAVQVQGHSGLIAASSGLGELVLLSSSSAGVATTSSIFPLRPETPLQGVRPFVLESAYQSTPGRLRCVVWAVRDKVGNIPSCCELFLVTVRYSGPDKDVTTESVQLLKRSPLPPHGTAVHPESDSILLAVTPDDSLQPKIEPAGLGAAPAPEAADDEDMPSPRTMQEAVARLSAFTSDRLEEGLFQPEGFDMYDESGPGGEGALGSDPDCTLCTFTCRPPTADPATPAAQDTRTPEDNLELNIEQGTASEAVDAPLGPPGVHSGEELMSEQAQEPVAEAPVRQVSQLSCSPHKVLAVTAAPHGLVLGLEDDVDCAVVEARLGDTPGALALQHSSYIPALAYVIAGKVQKKCVLLGDQASSTAAAIVETDKYCYVYKRTTPTQEHGESQVLETGLQDPVFGACITKQRDGKEQLLVLTKHQLLVHQL